MDFDALNDLFSAKTKLKLGVKKQMGLLASEDINLKKTSLRMEKNGTMKKANNASFGGCRILKYLCMSPKSKVDNGSSRTSGINSFQCSFLVFFPFNLLENNPLV